MPRLNTEVETKQKDLQHIENEVKASVNESRLSLDRQCRMHVDVIKIIPLVNICRHKIYRT